MRASRALGRAFLPDKRLGAESPKSRGPTSSPGMLARRGGRRAAGSVRNGNLSPAPSGAAGFPTARRVPSPRLAVAVRQPPGGQGSKRRPSPSTPGLPAPRSPRARAGRKPQVGGGARSPAQEGCPRRRPQTWRRRRPCCAAAAPRGSFQELRSPLPALPLRPPNVGLLGEKFGGGS